MDNFIFFIKQGFNHVLDINALDHVLFFIALIIIYNFKEWQKTLWLITFFTIGHSITFGLSVYNFITIDVDLVEFLIPITILVTLLMNIYKEFKGIKYQDINIYFALFFGLIHGLGFSNYFKILLDDQDNKMIPLVEFALGIELAQVVVVFIVLLFNFIAIKYLKITKKYWVLYLSILIILFIIPLIIKRFPL